jgi:hypothetical protein
VQIRIPQVGKQGGLFFGWWLGLVAAGVAQIPFDIAGPGVQASHFRTTTFATGLNYPVGMVELDDGSILVGTSNGSSIFGSTSGSLVRLADTNGDGVSDVRQTLVNNVPGGGLSGLRRQGDLFFATGQGSGKPISIYRAGATPADPLILQGTITLTYPGSWLHPHSALATRQTPSQPNRVDLLFQVGSSVNFAVTTSTVGMTSTIGATGTLAGDAIHMLTLQNNGTSVSWISTQQLATGLRNSAGMAFHPITGDLYLQDNGIDGFVNVNEPESADELNRIAVNAVGGAIEDFGFPQNYTQYRTGTFIGGGDIPPLTAFQPIPNPANGSEAEGPNDIAFAPSRFPPALRNGMFVGMHGRFSTGGITNEENPLVFVDLDDNSYFHFVENDEPNVGHLDGLLSTEDSLYIADITTRGDFGSASMNQGAIYQIKSVYGDFNADGIYNCADINQLTAAIAGGGSVATFDLSGDGQLTLADVDQWRSLAGEVNIGPGKSYLPADANLDTIVDGTDFGIWNSNKFTTTTEWCLGNFNADAVIDGSDFGIWNSNKFTMSDGAQVPEPASFWTWLLLAATVRRPAFRRRSGS